MLPNRPDRTDRKIFSKYGRRDSTLRGWRAVTNGASSIWASSSGGTGDEGDASGTRDTHHRYGTKSSTNGWIGLSENDGKAAISVPGAVAESRIYSLRLVPIQITVGLVLSQWSLKPYWAISASRPWSDRLVLEWRSLALAFWRLPAAVQASSCLLLCVFVWTHLRSS